MKIRTCFVILTLAFAYGCGDESDSDSADPMTMCTEKSDAEWKAIEDERGAECAQCLRSLYPPLGNTCDDAELEEACSQKCPPANRII